MTRFGLVDAWRRRSPAAPCAEPPGHAQSGQGLVEYALILILVAVVVVIVLLTQGQVLSHMFSNVACGLGASGCTGAG